MGEDSLQTIIPAEIDAVTDVGAGAEALGWSPNPGKSHVPGWNAFTSWCIDNRCPGLPLPRPKSAVTSSTWWRLMASRWPPPD